MKLIVLGFNHKTTPLVERERWYLPPSQIHLLLEEFSQLPHLQGVVYLATCNRIEVYAAVEEGFSQSPLLTLWKNFLGFEAEEEGPSYFYSDRAALDHLLRVAVGLDSLALGETQILGQVKQAYQQSLTLKVTNPFLNYLFQQVFRIAKQIRTETGITKCPTSISSVALLLIEQIFGNFNNLAALVIGLGEMGAKTAELLMKRGVKNLLITNRTLHLAEGFAKRQGGRVHPFDQLNTILPFVDLVITSTSSEQPILTQKTFSHLNFLSKDKSLILIDLGLPRDISPEVAELPNVYLYNIDDLKTIADRNRVFRKKEGLLAEAMIQEAIALFEKKWEKRIGRMSPIAFFTQDRTPIFHHPLERKEETK